MSSLLCTSTALAQSTTAPFSQVPFTDVPTTSIEYEAIEYLRTQNIIKGYIDGTFKPNNRINRAEFVEFMINPFILDTNGRGDCITENMNASTKSVFFKDVSASAWYAENIRFAKSKNIVNGYPDNTFRPADTINFVEAAKIIANVFAIDIGEYQAGEFWYKPYVQRLSDLHAIPTTVKSFDQTLTRGEMAQIVYRLKVGALNKSYMTFNAANNTLTARAATTAPAPVVKPPVTTSDLFIPNRRSIRAAAEEQNSVR